MGLLDDAIREHLELKRRRGTDPQEVERLEREALGPVRRAPHEAFDAPTPGEADAEDAFHEEPVTGSWSEDTDSAGPWADEPEGAWGRPEDELAEADRGADPLGSGEHELEEWDAPDPAPTMGGIGVEPDTAAPSVPAPPPAEPQPPPRTIDERDHLEQETVEHQVPEVSEEEDMLEETPEFLQDTPDHDRLWFEQRPPRDFDLDG
jgi:hypothetical protein